VASGISYAANTVDGVANLIPLVGTGKMVLEDGVKTLVKEGGEIFSEIAAEGGALRFSQTTASPWFSSQGTFAGQTISDVAGQLQAGTLSAVDVPVQVVTMDGNTLIVNTRSSLALSQAGIPQSSWNLIDMTGDSGVMNSITTRLGNNGLTTAGTPVLRITGSGGGASTYFGAGTIPPPP
jgi:hypothetical protein